MHLNKNVKKSNLYFNTLLEMKKLEENDATNWICFREKQGAHSLWTMRHVNLFSFVQKMSKLSASDKLHPNRIANILCILMVEIKLKM